MVAWLVAAPFVLICVAVGFIMEALFGMRLAAQQHLRRDWLG